MSKATAQLAGKGLQWHDVFNAFQKFVPISEHLFYLSTKFTTRKFPEFFLRRFSGKSLLFFTTLVLASGAYVALLT